MFGTPLPFAPLSPLLPTSSTPSSSSSRPQISPPKCSKSPSPGCAGHCSASLFPAHADTNLGSCPSLACPQPRPPTQALGPGLHSAACHGCEAFNHREALHFAGERNENRGSIVTQEPLPLEAGGKVTRSMLGRRGKKKKKRLCWGWGLQNSKNQQRFECVG